MQAHRIGQLSVAVVRRRRVQQALDERESEARELGQRAGSADARGPHGVEVVS
jgi:hypothetical protein